MKQQVEELQRIASQNQNEFSTVADAAHKSNDEAKGQIQSLERQIENLQLELSKAIGEKLEFEDMRQSYVDEIDCQKVNLVAAEELLKESKAESLEHKAENLSLKQEIERLRKAFEEQGHELGLVQAQVDIPERSIEVIILIRIISSLRQVEVYKTDFELERAARQEIAGEKERLIQDIQLLQRRNQALIDNAANRPSSSSSEPKPAKRATAPPAAAGAEDELPCPICEKAFKLNELERHVNYCLEKAQ